MIGTGVVTGRGKSTVRFVVRLSAVLIVVVWSGVSAAEVFNPSFEVTYPVLGRARPVPQNWWRADHPSFTSYCTDLWSTDGALSAALLTRANKTVNRGNHQSFYQLVDLTGMSSIVFDVALTASPAGAFEHFEASFLVDGVPVWSANEEGVYYDQEVSVLGLSDWHFLEMRLTALDAGAFTLTYWTLWDNIRLVEAPVAIPAVLDLDPGTLNLGSNGRWVTCYIELPEDYDVADIDGSMVTLDGIGACMDGQGWATPQANEGNILDHDGDGILERMVKFDRGALQAVVQPPETTITVQGYLTDGTPFEGTAVLQVLAKLAKKK